MLINNNIPIEKLLTEAQSLNEDLTKKNVDLEEALLIAIEAASQLFDLGVPGVRNRKNLLTWSHLAVTVHALRKELK